MPNLLQELLTRRVPQTLFVYLGVCWALIEVSAFIEERFALGRWLADSVMLVLVCGLMSAAVIAWNHGRRGPDPWKRTELIFHALVAVLAGGLVVWRVSEDPDKFGLRSADTDRISRSEVDKNPEDEPKEATELALESLDLGSLVASLPAPAPQSDLRCVVIAPAFLSTSFSEDERWVAHALELAIGRGIRMKTGVSYGNASRWFGESLAALNYGLGDEIPVPLLLTKAVARGCPNVLTLSLSGDGAAKYVVEAAFYREGRFEQPQRFRSVESDFIQLVDAIVLQTLQRLELSSDPVVPGLAESVSRHPGVFELLAKSDLARWDQKLEESAEFLDQAIELDPTCVDALMKRADMYGSAGNLPRARDLYGRALSFTYRLPPARRWRAIERILIQQGQLDAAWKVVERQTELDPGDSYAQVKRASWLVHMNRDYPSALKIVRDVLENDPTDSFALEYMTILSRESGDREAALNYARQFVSLRSEETKPLQILGDLALDAGLFDEAESSYQKLIALEPDRYVHRLKLAKLANRMGAFKRALDRLDEVSRFADSSSGVNVLEERSSIWFRSGRPRLALSVRKEAQSRARVESKIAPLLELGELVGLYEEAEQLEELAKRLSRIPEFEAPEFRVTRISIEFHLENSRGNSARAGELLGEVEILLGDLGLEDVAKFQDVLKYMRIEAEIKERNYGGALELLDSVEEGKPDNTQDLYGVHLRLECLNGLGRFGSAVALAREYESRDPGDAKLQVFLARALDGAKKPREAREAYRRALELWANAEDDYKPMLDARSALLELTARSE